MDENHYFYRVPGNSALVTALEEELNAKTPDDIDFEEPVCSFPSVV